MDRDSGWRSLAVEARLGEPRDLVLQVTKDLGSDPARDVEQGMRMASGMVLVPKVEAEEAQTRLKMCGGEWSDWAGD